MTKARAKIYARLIQRGKRTLAQLPESDRADVRAAYKEIFGEEPAE